MTGPPFFLFLFFCFLPSAPRLVVRAFRVRVLSGAEFLGFLSGYPTRGFAPVTALPLFLGGAARG